MANNHTIVYSREIEEDGLYFVTFNIMSTQCNISGLRVVLNGTCLDQIEVSNPTGYIGATSVGFDQLSSGDVMELKAFTSHEISVTCRVRISKIG